MGTWIPKAQRLSWSNTSKKKEEEEKEEEEEEAGREYLFFDIESSQDEGRYVANLLIVQDETGFEVVLKGDECVDQFGTLL